MDPEGENTGKCSHETCHTERAVVADHLMHLFAGEFWCNGVQLSVHTEVTVSASLESSSAKKTVRVQPKMHHLSQAMQKEL